MEGNGANIHSMFPIELFGMKTYPVKSARNVAVVLDKYFNFRSHISAICNACFYHIRDLRSIQSISQTSIEPISPAKPGSVAQQPNQCPTAKSRKEFHNINRPWGVMVSMGERPSQRDVSSDIS